MTRSQLIAQTQEKCPDSERRTVEEAVYLFFNEISSALQKGHLVELRGLGSFCVRQRKERIARNRKSGEKLKTASKKFLFFIWKGLPRLVEYYSHPKFSQISSYTVQSHPFNVQKCEFSLI